MCVQLGTDDVCVRRRRFIKPMKPLLPRKRSSSARIKLNRHWNELEELYGASRVTHFETLVLHNEVNDNAINEAREAASTRLQEDSSSDEDGLLTPPPTASFPAKSTFIFGGTAMEDDLPDLPMTPGIPQAWDVFAFPSATSKSNSTLHLTSRGVSD